MLRQYYKKLRIKKLRKQSNERKLRSKERQQRGRRKKKQLLRPKLKQKPRHKLKQKLRLLHKLRWPPRRKRLLKNWLHKRLKKLQLLKQKLMHRRKSLKK